MPSLITPQRRQRDSDLYDGEDDVDPGRYTNGSTGVKKARLSTKQDSLLLGGHRKSQGSQGRPHGPKHQPGAIVRVKLSNFVTYTAVEFFPGPSLNMVIGPNGTGKSTLVCAICLGLGSPPSLLGRAKDISEFVKHGCTEAKIEIELQGDPERDRRNPVIGCVIQHADNKTAFFINRERSNAKAVKKLAQSYCIQIDNLCQFLPQDRVVEFAAMTPIELLYSTQRAVGTDEMLEWHESLKSLRKDQQKLLDANAADIETLANLEERHRMQEADVIRLREREEVKEKIRQLEALRPVALYQEVKTQQGEAKRRRDRAHAELLQLEREVEPSLRAVNAKEEYRDVLQAVQEDRKRAVAIAEKKTERVSKSIDELKERFNDLDQEKKNEKATNITNKQERKRYESVISRLDKDMQQPPPEFDIAALQERRREKERQIEGFKDEMRQIHEENDEWQRKGRERTDRISGAQAEIEKLESQQGRQQNKLNTLSNQAAKAWEWVQRNQDKFEKPVYGPPVVECSVKDPRYVNLVESLFQQSDMSVFTTSTKNDFGVLHKQIHDVMRLGKVNITTAMKPLDSYQRPANEEELKQFGLEGWALDFLNGPEPVLSMLCERLGLHQTGVALRDSTEEQFDLIKTSQIASWAAGKRIYRITRRREYGPGAVSTSVRDVRQAMIWTDQPVDVTAVRQFKARINEWESEKAECMAEFNKLRERSNEIKGKKAVIDDEIQKIAVEKEEGAALQRAFAALPTKRAQAQAKLDAVNKTIAGVEERCMKLEKQQDDVSMQKVEKSLEYTHVIENLKQAHDDLQDVEIMFIEAQSDVEVLVARNTETKDMLEAKRQESNNLIAEFQAVVRKGKDAMKQVEELMRREPDLARNATAPTSVQALEEEIESERARLDLFQDGDTNTIREYERRQKQIDELKARGARIQEGFDEIATKIKEIRDQWEPKLDALIARISASFGYNMSQINCAGEVSTFKDETDFGAWAIQIKVKFREHEDLTILDAHRQSGGERAVSTIFYLMALQTLTRSPFRVVDEINQGMDPRNERLVHSRMVAIATGNDDEEFQVRGVGADGEVDGAEKRQSSGGSQYFLITPKLLHGLRYERGMRVLCIASGEYIPEDQGPVNIKRSLAIRKGMIGATASA